MTMQTGHKKKRVLVAPLDWGLGHATRCIPLIRLLLDKGCFVLIAGSDSSLALLCAEFPTLPFFTLPSYNPEYPRGAGMIRKMITQLPKFMRTIQEEHAVLENVIAENEIDIVFSDNRYGCWSSTAYSVFITHQSNVLMPKRFGWLSIPVRWVNEYLMKRFDECWIPDYAGEESLSGKLISFGKRKFHPKITFVGPLSRFMKSKSVQIDEGYDLIAICSGPEPQRSMFEELLKNQLRSCERKFLLIRGVVEPSASVAFHNGEIINFLTSNALNAVLDKAKLIIARSGFSTVMDMSALGKKVIFVPTPGQTEQEYLASRLMQKGVAYSMAQDALDLKQAFDEATGYSGFVANDVGKNKRLESAVSKIISMV
jgi:uncharacterized protein (TIGR00661 family)